MAEDAAPAAASSPATVVDGRRGAEEGGNAGASGRGAEQTAAAAGDPGVAGASESTSGRGDTGGEPRGGGLAALAAVAVARLLAVEVAGVTHPEAVFAKYLAAAAAPATVRAERLLDYSPLYLALVTWLAPLGYAAVLALQAVLHAATAAAAALAAARLAGERWAWLGGLGVASYRPFLVYCGIHEPETVILACLAFAVLAGLQARRRLTVASAALAFACLAAAALGRPQYLALVPVWALWMAGAAPPARRGAAHLLVWPVALAVVAAVVAPPVLERARATGAPVIMDPGAVVYEGNAPDATGLIRYAAPAVIELEHAHPESPDYGHVAYRRIASAAAGRPLGSAAANRFWTGLAWESIAGRPAVAARRLGRKALMALMPYEGHDLTIAERFDRRLQRWLPWGFALPLLALPWAALARRGRLAALAGPLAMVAVSYAVQLAGYASARQRLPAALALWIVLPALASDLLHGRLRSAVRPALALVLAVALVLGLAAATARVAVLDQLGWDELLGPRAPALGAALAAVQDGRVLRPRLRQLAERFAGGVDLARQARPAASLRLLEPLLGQRLDLTIDDRKVGVPEYWAAVDALALGRRAEAAALAGAAMAVRPEEPRIAALDLRLAAPPAAFLPAAASWRPPGCDPVSARLVLAGAAAADRDGAAVAALLRPLAPALPELVPVQMR
jgi:hypothetical protein